VTDEELVMAVRRRLGISTDPDPGRTLQCWKQLLSNPGSREKIHRVVRNLGQALEQAVRRQLGLNFDPGLPAEELDTLYRAFVAWLHQDEMKRSPFVSRLIQEAAVGKIPTPAPRPQPAMPRAPNTVQPPRPAAAPGPPREPSPQQAPAEKPPPNPTEEPVSPGATNPPDPPAITGPLWKYVAIPTDEPDPHAESDSRAAVSPEGWPIIGARVRGKKHKHEGTNCDDWFEFATAGCWTLIAVSDGAGSKRFSRVGARASCQAAIQQLTADLAKHRLVEREWSKEVFQRDGETGAFGAADVEHVQEALHRAMTAALEAVKREAETRTESPDHERVLGRKLVLSDLSATLLLAVHTRVRFKERDYSFALACQIGDGMTAALDTNGKILPLAVPDSGAFSGETDFLTSEDKLTRANLCRKTFPLFSPARALMVMTDGVADDYFPADPELLRLFADLVLNGALALPETGIEEQTVAPVDIETTAEVAAAEGPKQVRLRSAVLYAEKRGVSMAELVLSTPLLRAGQVREPEAPEPPCERLRVWLDSYQVRGSFDDRTLVVLHCLEPKPRQPEEPAAATTTEEVQS
jgi:hypothetical protein